MSGVKTNSVEVVSTNLSKLNENRSKISEIVKLLDREGSHSAEIVRINSTSSTSSSNISEPIDISNAEILPPLKRVPTVECLQKEEEEPKSTAFLSLKMLDSPRRSEGSRETSKIPSLDAAKDFLDKRPFLLDDRGCSPSGSEESNSEFEFLEAECEVSSENGLPEDVEDCAERNGFHVLSPIQENSENSEPSSNSTDGVKNFPEERTALRLLSSSLNAMSSPRSEEAQDPLMRSQTFPRSKTPNRRQMSFDQDFDPSLFPLEPRELDPSCFHQLHAADSQEELQEFLLLESECMSNDERRGLAAAFTPPESDERNSSGSENGSWKGTASSLVSSGKIVERAKSSTTLAHSQCQNKWHFLHFNG